MTDYLQQAKDFCLKTSTSFKCTYLRRGHYFHDDKEERDIYSITITRGLRSYTTEFGNAIQHSGKFMYIYRGTHYFHDHQTAFKTARKNGVPVSLIKRNENFKEPDEYTLLSGVQKYHPGAFEDFCYEMGYNDRPLIDYTAVLKIYTSVLNEWHAIQSLYNDDELELLKEIQ